MAETTLKSLIDRFRSRPDWQHADAAVRAEAVLGLPASEHQLVLALAREDEDPRVRRAAVKRLGELEPLSAIAEGDADAGVREEAAARLAQLLMHQADLTPALAALSRLQDARHLAGLAKGATLGALREAAVRALADPKALAGVVREAGDARIRLLALSRIEDGATLLALAQNLEHKPTAVAAVDRLSDPEALHAVAARARVGAAARRARARLETGEPAAPPAAPAAQHAATPDDVEAERRAYEEARAALARETELAQARAQAALAERDAQARGEDEQAREARRARLVEIVEQAEALAGQEPAAARGALRELEPRFAEAAGTAGFDELRERFAAAAAAVTAAVETRRAEHAEKLLARQQALAELAARAEALVAKGEQAALRDTDQALREIKDALASPGELPSRRERDALLHRLEAARRELYPLLQLLREDTEWKRWANVSVQEQLAERAEALVAEQNLDRAAARLHELELRWRQAREAPKDKGEALWARFKAARDQVQARVDAHLAAEAERHAANLALKEALCEKAEALAESSDWAATATALRALQAEWKAVGPVPRAVSQRVWERFRKPCDRFFTRFSEHRDERGRTWDQNLAQKEALCERAEALQGSSDWDAAAAAVKQLQLEWRGIGPVKKSRADAVWRRFRAACDQFFDRYKNRDAHARDAAREARERLCAELEALAPAQGAAAEPPADLLALVQAAQTAWRQAGGLPQDELAALDARFYRARDRVLELYPGAFEGSELDPEASRRRAEKLVARVEGLLEGLAPKAASEAASASDLAARLRDALASNTIGGREALEQRWHSAATELDGVVAAWKRLGPLTGEAGRALHARFDAACRRFEQDRPRPDPRRAEASQRPRRERRERPDRPERRRR